jgi:crotonobetainyl-CoA:carnitine CoA-transferase CaiB-like acyl-CoA transferase
LVIDKLPPRLGEHSGEILREAGFTPTEVEAMVTAGVTSRMAGPG